MCSCLALKLVALLAAVPDAKVAGLAPIATALVDVALDAAQVAVTAEEPVGDARAAATGRRARPRLRFCKVQ